MDQLFWTKMVYLICLLIYPVLGFYWTFRSIKEWSRGWFDKLCAIGLPALWVWLIYEAIKQYQIYWLGAPGEMEIMSWGQLAWFYGIMLFGLIVMFLWWMHFKHGKKWAWTVVKIMLLPWMILMWLINWLIDVGEDLWWEIKWKYRKIKRTKPFWVTLQYEDPNDKTHLGFPALILCSVVAVIIASAAVIGGAIWFLSHGG